MAPSQGKKENATTTTTVGAPSHIINRSMNTPSLKTVP